MSDENLIGVDPLDWMNKEEVAECKQELSEDDKPAEVEDHADKSKTIFLDSRFDIRSLEEFKSIFRDMIEKSSAVKIDVSNVDKVDAASLQFLAAFKKTADQKLVKVSFENLNEYFLSAIGLMGLEEVFETKS